MSHGSSHRSHPCNELISLAALEAAKKLIKEPGGVDKAKRAIESLARLVD